MRFIEIIKQCINNDDRSKELLYKTFYGYIKGVLIRYLLNPHDLEELINDSFIKIFQHLHHFTPEPSEEETIKIFKGWIGKIASRTAIDHLRKHKKNLLVDNIENKEAAYVPFTHYTTLESQEILTLLKKIPVMHSMVFNLYEVEGFTHEEIAAQLSITASSSRVFLCRAKNKLKTLYLQQQTVKKEIE